MYHIVCHNYNGNNQIILIGNIRNLVRTLVYVSLGSYVKTIKKLGK